MSGNEIGTLNDQEFNLVLNELSDAIKANESLGAFNLELLKIIEELQAGSAGGQRISELLGSLFSLIAALQAQVAAGQQPVGGFVQEEEDPVGNFFNFIGDIYIGFLNLFGVR